MDQGDNGMWAVLGIVIVVVFVGLCLWGVFAA